MALYAISFRVEHEDNYDDRYQSLVSAIKAQASGPAYWEETTSFVLLVSDKSPADLADAIVAASKFNANKDLLLGIHLSTNRGYAIRGHCTDKDVITLLRDHR
jgi:hypothetical protein